MAYQQPPYSPASVDSDDYHFGSLSKLEEQSLLIPDEYPSNPVSSPLSPTNSPAPPRATAFLDGVRGVAALLVFLHYFAPQFYMDEPTRGYGQRDPITNETWHHFMSFPYVRLFYSGGDAAVALFFVLSGFVISIAPLRRITNTVREGGGSREEWRSIAKSILSAVVRRPIRLYLPIFLIAIVFAMLRHTPVGPLTSSLDIRSSLLAEISSCIHEFIKFFNPFQQHGTNREWFAYGVIYWTIPIELKGSMLVFLLTGLYAFASQSRFYRRLYFLQLMALCTALLFINQWTMSLFVAGLILAICDVRGLHLSSIPLQLPFLNRRRHSSGSPSRLFQLFSQLLNHTILLLGGYLLSQPGNRSTIANSLYTPGWQSLTTLIPSMYLTANGEITWFDPEYFRFWTSIGSMLSLYAVLNIGWCQRVFMGRVPQYLGKVSFALYFTHILVGMITEHAILRTMGQWIGSEPMGEYWYDNKLYLPDRGMMGLTPRYLGCSAIELAVCLLVAHAATILFDRPAIRLSRWFAKVLGLGSSDVKGQPAWSQGPRIEKMEWSEKDKERWLA